MKTDILIQTRGQYLKNSRGKVPQKRDVYHFLNEMIAYLFPILSDHYDHTDEKNIDDILLLLKRIMESYDSGMDDTGKVIEKFEETLPGLYEMLTKDAVAINEGDPAARSIEEVIICYPGFYAIVVYRLAHELAGLSIPIVPRILTEYAHSKTGIDIHANAKIGESFCIDHGTGIVIGETTEIGHRVKIYQGVTLGALSVAKRHAGKKRHPTIGDHTVIYAGSTILGGNTIIGHHSIIGGTVWLTHSVEPYSIVLNQVKVHLQSNDPTKRNVIDFVI